MAFKMKGNPYKMGKVATKSALKMAKENKEQSAAKQFEEGDYYDTKTPNKKSPMELKTSYKMKEAMAKMKENSAMKQAKPDYPDIDGDGNTKESMKQAAADKKSPMEQKSSKGFMSAYNKEMDKLVDKYSKDGRQASRSEIPQAEKDALKARVRSKFKKEEGKSPMEMSSPMLQGRMDDGGVFDRRKEYKGGSIYNYFEEPTQDNIDDMLGYASFLETTATPGAKGKAARIRQHAADDLQTMESDKSAREDSEAENRRLMAEGELGPQG